MSQLDELPLIELPLPCTLDEHDIDPLLAKLRAVHGQPRADIAPELTKASAITARRAAAP